MMGESIDQIVILISSEDGANQIFVKRPLEFVPELKRVIDVYYEANPKQLLSNADVGTSLFE